MLRRLAPWGGMSMIAIALLATTDARSVTAFDGHHDRYGISRYPAFNYRNYRNYRVPSGFRSYGYPARGYGYGSYQFHPFGPHYDYHAPRVVPHNDHLDIIPGHFHSHHAGRRGW